MTKPITSISRIPVFLIVGDPLMKETIDVEYEGSTAAFLWKLRAAIKYGSTTFYTNLPRMVIAMLSLHKLGEIELSVFNHNTGFTHHVDVKGEMIEPWPDEFFEIEFHARFNPC